jgi:hypothetical protein
MQFTVSLLPFLTPSVLFSESFREFFIAFCSQNLMFYYENESSTRPSGVVLLEGSYCERLVLRSSNPDRQLAVSLSFYRRSVHTIGGLAVAALLHNIVQKRKSETV